MRVAATFAFVLLAICLSSGYTADLLSRGAGSRAAYTPLVYKVQPSAPECLFDNFSKSDVVTFR